MTGTPEAHGADVHATPVILEAPVQVPQAAPDPTTLHVRLIVSVPACPQAPLQAVLDVSTHSQDGG